MSKMIQIRNVPDALHRKLKSRAALAGLTLSEYLLREAESAAERPTLEEWRKRMEGRPRVHLTESPADAIRAERDSR
jgi:plasmid stability protein